MKRTREKTEVMEEEEIRSQMFDSEVNFFDEGKCFNGAYNRSPQL